MSLQRKGDFISTTSNGGAPSSSGVITPARGVKEGWGWWTRSLVLLMSQEKPFAQSEQGGAGWGR